MTGLREVLRLMVLVGVVMPLVGGLFWRIVIINVGNPLLGVNRDPVFGRRRRRR
jgi:hypothetical protein